MIKPKRIFENFLAIIFGIFLTGFLLEIFARLVPAADLLSLETPIECEDLDNIKLNCLPRRKAGKKGTYTLGAFPPLPIKAKKSANDIGQLTDVNFGIFQKNKPENIKIISIGDSFVAALQVDNNETFHGLLNQYHLKSNKGQKLPIVSSAIAASGLALPSYLKAIEFVENKLDNIDDIYFVIPIIANDFDESFRKYQPTGVGFYFTEDNTKYEHFPYPKTLSSEVRRLLLNNFAFGRYLLININAAQIMYKYPICKIWIDCTAEQNYAANVIEESEKENPQRFKSGYLATRYFLNNLAKIRANNQTRNKTIFVIDSDRQHIYDKKNKRSTFFESQRENFISEAKLMGFRVIDTQEIFEKDYNKYKKKFEFINDNHWNQRGHKLVSEAILFELNQIKE